MIDGGEDPGALGADRLCELDERLQAAPARPSQPGVEHRLGVLGRHAVEGTQLLLQEVGAVERPVDGLDVGQLEALAAGQALGVLPQREAGALEVLGRGDLAGLASGVPDLAADLIQRVGGQLHDVEGVNATDRAWQPFGDWPGDPGGHVAGHQRDLFAALLSQRVEEGLDALAVTARSGPDQPAAVVIDYDSQVAVALAVADLIDPDPPQAIEQIDLALRLDHHALADPADGAPRDAHQLGHRSLAGVDRQPHATWSSKARVKRASWRAHGTAQTTTP